MSRESGWAAGDGGRRVAVVPAFVLAGAGFLVGWQVAELAGASRETGVVLGLFGFVLYVVFGKAYALVPNYFECELTVTWAPPVQLSSRR